MNRPDPSARLRDARAMPRRHLSLVTTLTRGPVDRWHLHPNMAGDPEAVLKAAPLPRPSGHRPGPA